MRINFINSIKYPALTLFTACSLGYATQVSAQTTRLQQTGDTFAYVYKETINPVDKYPTEALPVVFRETVNPSSWTNDPKILKNSPDPYFTLQGKKTLAKGAVDIKNCRFYVYNEHGQAVESFLVATGAHSTPTEPGIRKVLDKQMYPYKSCPPSTKRYRFPRDYGPRLAYLHHVDTITGKLFDNGDYLHGTKREFLSVQYLPNAKQKIIPKRKDLHFTHSCVRLPNRDAMYVVLDVLKIGDYLKYVK